MVKIVKIYLKYYNFIKQILTIIVNNLQEDQDQEYRQFPTISTQYRILRNRVLDTATIIVRHNAQTVQYIVRVVIVRYRITNKRLFTQQVLFIIHLSIIQHFYIMCWIVYPRHQPTYNQALYQPTLLQLLSIPLDSTAKPCYTTKQTSVRCLADFQRL